MTESRNFCVYRHTAPNGKVYIGITGQNPVRRWNSGRGYKNNPHLFAAILKYGWDNFTHEILYADLNKAEAEELEIRLIAEYQATDPAYGYNHATGGAVNRGNHLSLRNGELRSPPRCVTERLRTQPGKSSDRRISERNTPRSRRRR